MRKEHNKMSGGCRKMNCENCRTELEHENYYRTLNKNFCSIECCKKELDKKWNGLMEVENDL
jgi:hypothetical protein